MNKNYIFAPEKRRHTNGMPDFLQKY